MNFFSYKYRDIIQLNKVKIKSYDTKYEILLRVWRDSNKLFQLDIFNKIISDDKHSTSNDNKVKIG